MIQVHHELSSWSRVRDEALASGRKIGFVPTMGALHEGHLSLLKRARVENDVVLLSIFVNPTQFDNAEDLAKYPLMPEQDIKLAESVGCDHVLLPNRQMMYPDDYRYRVSESRFSNALCGAHRPGHFDGVLTVVLKLFNIAGANRSYFGEKDFQQLELIREMARAFFLRTEVIGLPTLREADGLAMSSRNLRLSADERAKAPQFANVLVESLRDALPPDVARAKLESLGFRVDYVEDHVVGMPAAKRRFGAVFLGAVRLIDNVTADTSLNAIRGAS